ncbi:MAG: class I SAM-dependent methyltransferase [Planctomycetes bacterium]|nr:class I SAM-dependent methyltransferase [Planctomycetota bacterium]
MAVQTSTKKPKKKSKTKDKKKARKVTLARLADKHDLYERAVQGPEEDSKFFARYYKKYVGYPAKVFREDFCGTALLSSHWVMRKPDHVAIGVDLDGPTLEYGQERHVDRLTEHEQSRITLIQDDVRNVKGPKADILCALNFSYCVFKQRDELRAYLANCFESLAPDGLLFLDSWGGSETQVEQVEEREVDDYTYCWDQHKFDPLTYNAVCKIHFEFKDGSRLNNAFVYDWRLWTLPELQELYHEVGFDDVHVLWEGTDKKSGEGNGVFRRVKTGDADDAWIAYVVGRKSR